MKQNDADDWLMIITLTAFTLAAVSLLVMLWYA